MLKKYMLFYLLALVLLVAVFMKAFGTDTLEKMQAAAEAPQAEAAQTVSSMQSEEKMNSGDYFDSFRRERESIRQQEIRYLDEVIATGNIDAQTLDEALEQKLALVENMEKEFAVESMIAAKGFRDAAVTFHNDSINVVVDAQTLSNEEVAQILDIVKRETGAEARNVKITAEGTGGVS